jgi:hypothetical protein
MRICCYCCIYWSLNIHIYIVKKKVWIGSGGGRNDGKNDTNQIDSKNASQRVERHEGK